MDDTINSNEEFSYGVGILDEEWNPSQFYESFDDQNLMEYSNIPFPPSHSKPIYQNLYPDMAHPDPQQHHSHHPSHPAYSNMSYGHPPEHPPAYPAQRGVYHAPRHLPSHPRPLPERPLANPYPAQPSPSKSLSTTPRPSYANPQPPNHQPPQRKSQPNTPRHLPNDLPPDPHLKPKSHEFGPARPPSDAINRRLGYPPTSSHSHQISHFEYPSTSSHSHPPNSTLLPRSSTILSLSTPQAYPATALPIHPTPPNYAAFPEASTWKPPIQSLSLFHKPRGTAGKYMPIEQNEIIRVSPQAGKRLRLLITATTRLENIAISVMEWTGEAYIDRALQGIEVLAHQYTKKQTGDLPSEIQFDVKLTRRGKFQFAAVDVTVGVRSRMITTSFIATNTPQKKNQHNDSKTQSDSSYEKKASEVVEPLPKGKRRVEVVEHDEPSSTPTRSGTSPNSEGTVDDTSPAKPPSLPLPPQMDVPPASAPSVPPVLPLPAMPQTPSPRLPLAPQVLPSSSPQLPLAPPVLPSSPQLPPSQPSTGDAIMITIKDQPPEQQTNVSLSSTIHPKASHKSFEEDEIEMTTVSKNEENEESGNEASHEDLEFISKKRMRKKRKGSREKYAVYGDMDVKGEVRARAFFQYSDIRLKTNIEDIVDAMSIVNSLSGKRYSWKEGTPMNAQTGGQRVIGLIAQQVRTVLPEVVKEDENGWLSVSYADIVPILINAFNEQTQELKNFHEEVRTELSQLRHSLQRAKLEKSSDAALQTQIESVKSSLHRQSMKVEEPVAVPMEMENPVNHLQPKLKKFGTYLGLFILFSFALFGIAYIAVHSQIRQGNKPDVEPLTDKNITSIANECLDLATCNQNIDPFAICTKTFGSHICQCFDGYFISNESGVCNKSYDYCAHMNSCGNNSICVNQPTTGICQCSPGFTGDGNNCFDIGSLTLLTRLQLLKDQYQNDLIALQNGLNTQYSQYLVASFSVDVPQQQSLLTVFPTVTDRDLFSNLLYRFLYTNYRISPSTINYQDTTLQQQKRSTTYFVSTISFSVSSSPIECTSSHNPCHPARPCTIVEGYPTCGNCAPGYTNTGDTGCKDINECDTPGVYCDIARDCINTEGSYTCGDCRAPYVNYGERSCSISVSQDVDCQYGWSVWSQCSVDCNGGTKSRSPVISLPSNGQGKPCPSAEVVSCNTQPCPAVVGCYSRFNYKTLFYLDKNSNVACTQACFDLHFSYAATTGNEGSFCACSSKDLQSNALLSLSECSTVCPQYQGAVANCDSPFLCCGGSKSYTVVNVTVYPTYSGSYLSQQSSGSMIGGLSSGLFGGDLVYFVGTTLGIEIYLLQGEHLALDCIVETPNDIPTFGDSIAFLAYENSTTVLAVGDPLDSSGAVYLVTINVNGKIQRKVKLSAPGTTPVVSFGSSIANLGDIDGNGVNDIVVGAPEDLNNQGSIMIILFNPDRSIKSYQLHNAQTNTTLYSLLSDQSQFGYSVTSLGDIDGDGIPDLAVGSPTNHLYGSVFTITLTREGTIKSVKNYQNPFQYSSNFGSAVIKIDNPLKLLVGADMGGLSGNLLILDLSTPITSISLVSLPSLVAGALFGAALSVVPPKNAVHLGFVVTAMNTNMIYVGDIWNTLPGA